MSARGLNRAVLLILVFMGLIAMTSNTQSKRYGVRAWAIIAFAVGAAAICLARNSFGIEGAGFAALFVGMQLLRRSGADAQPRAFTVGPAPNQPAKFIWIVSIALIPALGVSCYLISVDVRHGGHEGWLAYLLGGLVLLCAGFWSALAAKLGQ